MGPSRATKPQRAEVCDLAYASSLGPLASACALRRRHRDGPNDARVAATRDETGCVAWTLSQPRQAPSPSWRLFEDDAVALGLSGMAQSGIGCVGTGRRRADRGWQHCCVG